MVGIVKRAWIPLLIVVVIALGGIVVYRMHGFFGSDNETTRPGAGLAQDAEPFNPQGRDLPDHRNGRRRGDHQLPRPGRDPRSASTTHACPGRSP